MAELPAVARALLETIAGPESAGAYDVIYGGSRFSDYSDHPREYITIRSGPNRGKKSSAAGKYQFLASTWDSYQRKLSLPDFSPASQDQAAWQLAQDEYFRDTGRDLQTDLENGNLDLVAPSLKNQWTSMPGGIEQGISGGEFRTAFASNLNGTPRPPGLLPEVASQVDISQAKEAPLYTFDSQGRPINAETGRPVAQTDPVFSALMAYQQASTATRPVKQAPAPAVQSQDMRLARNPAMSQEANTGGRAAPPLPQARPERAIPPVPRARPEREQSAPRQPSAADLSLTGDITPATPRMTNSGGVTTPYFSDLTKTDLTGGRGSLTPEAGGAKPSRLPSIAGPSDDVGQMPTFNALSATMGGSALSIPQSYAGQDARPVTKTVMRETQVRNPAYDAALRMEIPLGSTFNPRSRDSVAQAAAGRAMATRMPPKWITVPRPMQIEVSGARNIGATAPRPASGGNALGLRQAGGYLYAPSNGGWTQVGRANTGLTPAQQYEASRRAGMGSPSGDPWRRWDLSTDSGNGSRDWTNTQ